MPNVVDRRTLLQFPKKKSSLVAAGPQLGGVLANRKAAMEQVFAATHGRPMTEAERQRFKETGD
ncbi:MAG TPA: hypothetical protein VG498_16595 [Terriglobales bacterium]|nr:hypothetical protein [Terriglobales bacterium]